MTKYYYGFNMTTATYGSKTTRAVTVQNQNSRQSALCPTTSKPYTDVTADTSLSVRGASLTNRPRSRPALRGTATPPRGCPRSDGRGQHPERPPTPPSSPALAANKCDAVGADRRSRVLHTHQQVRSWDACRLPWLHGSEVLFCQSIWRAPAKASETSHLDAGVCQSLSLRHESVRS